MNLTHRLTRSTTTSADHHVSENPNIKLTQPDDKPQFPGSRSDWTSNLQFLRPDDFPGIPVYRVMDRTGALIDEQADPNLGKETITKMYKGLNF
jgi:hypothetical protein